MRARIPHVFKVIFQSSISFTNPLSPIPSRPIIPLCFVGGRIYPGYCFVFFCSLKLVSIMNTSCMTRQLLLIKHCISCRFGLLTMPLISAPIVFIRMCHRVRLICGLLVNMHMNIKCKHKCSLMRRGLLTSFSSVPFYTLLIFERTDLQAGEGTRVIRIRIRTCWLQGYGRITATNPKFICNYWHFHQAPFARRSSLISHLGAVCHKSVRVHLSHRQLASLSAQRRARTHKSAGINEQ